MGNSGTIKTNATLFFASFCIKYIMKQKTVTLQLFSCLALFDSLGPLGLQPSRFLCLWDSPGKKTGVGCHALLQGIFPTQGSNPGLPHCRGILYQLSHQRSPRILELSSLSLLQGIFPRQESNQGHLHCRWILYQLSSPGGTPSSSQSSSPYPKACCGLHNSWSDLCT